MFIVQSDTQTVGETESTLFSTIQQGPVEALIMLKNSGVNPVSYRFDQYTGLAGAAAWQEVGASGTDFQNVLVANELKSIKLLADYPQVRLTGYASGGGYLEFTLTRCHNRASGGSLPILAV